MKELTELRFNDNRIIIKDSLVKSPILPKLTSELERDVVVQGNCIIEGAVYARNLEIQQGPLTLKSSVFTQVELHVNTDANGLVVFEKAVGSASSVVSHAPGCRLHFLADISAKQVKLRNAYVAASIFADDVVLEDCVVIGGVFATRCLELHNCIIGTFNSPTVRCSKTVNLLLPSAFSIESVTSLPGTEFFNLSLADLGALMRGIPEAMNSGRIPMNLTQDEQKTVLINDVGQQILRSYSVVGKVLAADLLDFDRFQNHFLLTNAGLGNQLIRTFDLGLDNSGNRMELTPDTIASFFFAMLDGKIQARDLDGTFTMNDILKAFGEDPSVNSTAAAPLSEKDFLGEIDADLNSSTMAFCTKCGTGNEVDSTFCANCGEPLISTCLKCGVVNELDSTFCANCGEPMS